MSATTQVPATDCETADVLIADALAAAEAGDLDWAQHQMTGALFIVGTDKPEDAVARAWIQETTRSWGFDRLTVCGEADRRLKARGAPFFGFAVLYTAGVAA